MQKSCRRRRRRRTGKRRDKRSMLVGRQGGEDGVSVGEEEAGGKERDEGGEERSGVQETTGMCRMAGGWPEERTVKK